MPGIMPMNSLKELNAHRSWHKVRIGLSASRILHGVRCDSIINFQQILMLAMAFDLCQLWSQLYFIGRNVSKLFY